MVHCRLSQVDRYVSVSGSIKTWSVCLILVTSSLRSAVWAAATSVALQWVLANDLNRFVLLFLARLSATKNRHHNNALYTNSSSDLVGHGLGIVLTTASSYSGDDRHHVRWYEIRLLTPPPPPPPLLGLELTLSECSNGDYAVKCLPACLLRFAMRH